MTPRRRWLPLSIPASLALSAGLAAAFSSGPGNGLTNAPGEANCTNCHNTSGLNSGSGSLGLAGIAAEYNPAEAYTLQVTVADPSALRWGFEFTILDAAGASAGVPAPLDGTTRVSATGNRTYVTHTSAGTSPGTTGSRTWQVSWTAPATGTGNLTLYMAGNAANNNNANTGDRIYATSFPIAEKEVAVERGTWGRIKATWR
jgi:hypothetical protein